jgi:hypothetical protein|tara:strand:- start:937 stop:1116 length:180 start_codon:yes stop_codon:yes gene_type:complete
MGEAIPEKRQSQKQKMQWRSYVLEKLPVIDINYHVDDQRNIREIVARHPHKKDYGPGTE